VHVKIKTLERITTCRTKTLHDVISVTWSTPFNGRPVNRIVPKVHAIYEDGVLIWWRYDTIYPHDRTNRRYISSAGISR